MRLPPPITSRTNERVKTLRAAFVGRGGAQAGELTAIEGEHLLGEAAAAGVELEAVYVRVGNEGHLERAELGGLRAREWVRLSREVFDAAVETASPQGVAGVLRIPEQRVADGAASGPVLLLENVQDPGNVGTLIRSAAAFGAAAVWLVGECAQAWSPKVLRASVGAVFRVEVMRGTLAEAMGWVRPRRRVWAAVPAGAGATAVMTAGLGGGVLMIGHEGRGLTAEALALSDARVTIPCAVESLNAAVAGSVLLYEAMRQRSEEAETAV